MAGISKSSLFLFFGLFFVSLRGQELTIVHTNDGHRVNLAQNDKLWMASPKEGLWSIATAWDGQWPSGWRHVPATGMEKLDEWTILSGSLSLPEGDWLLRDAYRPENGRVKVVRRWEWRGKQILKKTTLAVRWQIPTQDAVPLLPGILYYGNPSGEKNGPENVAWYHSQPGEEAYFEEHRYPMPFASLEWQADRVFFGAALHTLPSPVYRGNHFDQWWSLGVKTETDHSELVLLSGPIAYNGRKNTAKALQTGHLPYGDTWIDVPPGAVIEKTFYLEAYPVKAKGRGFQQPVHTSIDLFKPFYADDLPTYADIVRHKYRFAQSRWVEGPDFAGFNMFPAHVDPRIVAGWAGQCEAPGYALQGLARQINDPTVWDKIQRSLDHISASPIDEEGFCVIYHLEKKEWSGKDPVSQGQTMNSIALAIREGRKNKKVNTQKWEVFLKKACDVFAKRLLSPDWAPRNTAEAFFISPLILSAQLFKNQEYKKAALKAAEYYAARHTDMSEPYWGGTLDATCEDKEGAWGAFQGFLAAYETTREKKFLDWARHACDVVLSYTVVWDIPLPAGRLADHAFKTRGWTGVSAQNQHLDVYGVVIAPSVYKMGLYLKDPSLRKLAVVMFRSCGQMTAPSGAHGEQIQETNFAQHGDMSDVFKLRGGYSENWTVFWITAHFLHAAAQFEEMGATSALMGRF